MQYVLKDEHRGPIARKLLRKFRGPQYFGQRTKKQRCRFKKRLKEVKQKQSQCHFERWRKNKGHQKHFESKEKVPRTYSKLKISSVVGGLQMLSAKH